MANQLTFFTLKFAKIASAMLKPWVKKTLDHWPVTLILSVWLCLLLTNTYNDTWLLGWDSVAPEFNLKVNFMRAVFPAWQEFQGLGLAGGMGHGSDLTRLPWLALSTFILPANLIRYSWLWLMVLAGPLGVYALGLRLFRHQQNWVNSLAAATAALFYLANLATIQYFFVPLETFSSFFGWLPWLTWAVITYWEEPKASQLARWWLVSLLSTSAFYVQTLLVVFGFVFGGLAIEHSLRRRLRGLLSVGLAGITLGVTQFFWFAPVAYFTLTAADTTVNALQNRLATPEVQAMNHSFGSWFESLRLRGYWFEYADVSLGDPIQSRYLLEKWRTFTAQSHIISIEWALTILAGVGLILAVVRRQKWSIAWFGIGTWSLVMLSAGNGWLGWIFNQLVTAIPLFGQMFRVAFTKWSLVTALSFSLGLGWSVAIISAIVPTKFKASTAVISSLLIMSLSLGSVWPAFQGQFLYQGVKPKLPLAYLHVQSFFQSQPTQTRIAILPIPDFWGWSFTNWGYRGSGFLWYGIPQPILDRNFDVWSSANETFYHQLSTALYGRNIPAIKAILDQYDVTYLLLDSSIAVPGKNQELLRYTELPTILDRVGAKPIWNEGSLTVYQLTPAPVASFVTAPGSFRIASADTRYARIDPVYQQLGNYIEPLPTVPSQTVFPFANLTRTWLTNVRYEADGVHLIGELPATPEQQRLVIPTPAVGEQYTTPVSVLRTADGLLLEFAHPGELRVAGQRVSLPQLPQLDLPLTAKVAATTQFTISLGDQRYELASTAAQLQVMVPLEFGRSLPIKVSYQSGPSLSARTDTFTLPAEIWRNLAQPPELIIPPGTTQLEAVVASQAIELPFANLPGTNCDVLQRGNSRQEQGQSTVSYFADQYGAWCTGLPISQLNTNQSWLLRWRGENRQGRSLKWYLTNQSTQHTDLEELLPSGQFDRTSPVQAWPLLPASGYSLNWETRSFGQPSQNLLAAVTAYPLPLSTLTQLQVIPVTGSYPLTAFSNQVTIRNLRKTGTYQYQFAADVTSSNGLITLSQGYDAGWLGFVQPSGSRWPWQWQRLAHTRYNGWANAWIIPDRGTHTVLLFYWPQLLSFAGFIALGVSGGVILTWSTLRFVQASRSKISS